LPKIGFVSLGCPKNLVDSEVMMGLLARAGYELTPRAEEAEIIVVNTCSFINPAKKESIQAILEMAGHKKSGSARKLIVAGCLVERYREEIRKEIPEVDAVIGTNEVERIVAVCAQAADGAGVPLPALAPYLYHEATPRVLATPRHYAYVKITEGCDHPCSFCVIPKLRGPFRSRRLESVVAETERLFSQGVREINLIGQDTTWYGEDLGLTDGLALLLERLAQLPPAGWIRFLYCYPNRVTQRLLDTVAAWPALVKYFDIPLQHASGALLKRMRRGQTGAQFLRLIERIRRTVPGVALRTSMIVGFPGETETDFQELCDFIRAARFDNLGVFAYSDEEGTRSFELDGKLDGHVIHNRRRHLMALQRGISRRKNRALVGQRLDLLLDGVAPESELLWEGRLATQAPEIDGKVLINEVEGPAPASGCFAEVEITAAMDYDLIGRIVAVRGRCGEA
jgi:ribosomal protein S12 methylthiotransferase